MKWIALAFLVVWFVSWLMDRGVDSFALWLHLVKNRFDGNPRSRGRSTPNAAVDPPSTPTTDPGWGPFAVDASNGSLTPTEREDIRRLGGLVEVHRVPEGIVPPKSRPMRRTIH